MNKQTLNAIAYAQDAVSFLFLDAAINDFVNNIYLYGSAVRGELTKDSDIDIFIDCKTDKEKLIEALSKSALSKFYKSKDFDKWKLFRFDYPISFQTGELDTWHLKTSIMAEGIVLYSKKQFILPAERKVLFTYILPKKKNQYLHFTRTLFGRKEKGYKDKGVLGQANGEKFGTNVIIVAKENQQKVAQFMNKEKINYSMKEICVMT